MAPHYQGTYGFRSEKILTPYNRHKNVDKTRDRLPTMVDTFQTTDVYEFHDDVPPIGSFHAKKTHPATMKMKDCCITIDCVKCKMCNRVYKCPSDMNCHGNNTSNQCFHDSIRCELCDESFESSEHLHEHLRKVHKCRTIVWKIGNEVIGKRTVKRKYLKSKSQDLRRQTIRDSKRVDSRNCANSQAVFELPNNRMEDTNDEVIEVLRISRKSSMEDKINEESPTRLQREMLVLEAIAEIEKFQNDQLSNERAVPDMANMATNVSRIEVNPQTKRPCNIVGNQFTAIPRKTYLDIMADMQVFRSDSIDAPEHSFYDYGIRYEDLLRHEDNEGFALSIDSYLDPLSRENEVIIIED